MPAESIPHSYIPVIKIFLLEPFTNIETKSCAASPVITMLFRVTTRVSWLIRTNLMWLFSTTWRQLKLSNFTLPRMFLSRDADDHALKSSLTFVIIFSPSLFPTKLFKVFIVSLIRAARSVHLLIYFITIMYWWTVQIVELPVMQLSSASDYCLLLKGKEAEACIVLSSEWFAPVSCSPYRFSTVRYMSLTKWQCCTRDWNM